MGLLQSDAPLMILGILFRKCVLLNQPAGGSMADQCEKGGIRSSASHAVFMILFNGLIQKTLEENVNQLGWNQTDSS